jgi:hypothetical protein
MYVCMYQHRYVSSHAPSSPHLLGCTMRVFLLCMYVCMYRHRYVLSTSLLLENRWQIWNWPSIIMRMAVRTVYLRHPFCGAGNKLGSTDRVTRTLNVYTHTHTCAHIHTHHWSRDSYIERMNTHHTYTFHLHAIIPGIADCKITRTGPTVFNWFLYQCTARKSLKTLRKSAWCCNWQYIHVSFTCMRTLPPFCRCDVPSPCLSSLFPLHLRIFLWRIERLCWKFCCMGLLPWETK